jgi:hypothetical protein
MVDVAAAFRDEERVVGGGVAVVAVGALSWSMDGAYSLVGRKEVKEWNNTCPHSQLIRLGKMSPFYATNENMNETDQSQWPMWPIMRQDVMCEI